MAPRRQEHGDRRARLARLRREVAALERGHTPPGGLGLGWPAVDAHLPAGGLARGAVHAVGAGDATGAAALGLAVHVAARAAPDPVVWCAPPPLAGTLYGPGLACLGLEPTRLVLAVARRTEDLLWSLEEALASGTPALVVGEVAAPARTAVRRLALAAERGGSVGLLLSRQGPGDVTGVDSRWQVAAHPHGWALELTRLRGGAPAAWVVPRPDPRPEAPQADAPQADAPQADTPAASPPHPVRQA